MPERSLEDAVRFEVRGRVAIITINQPEKLNAITQHHYTRISYLLEEIALMDKVVMTVITGTGRFFSA